MLFGIIGIIIGAMIKIFKVRRFLLLFLFQLVSK